MKLYYSIAASWIMFGALSGCVPNAGLPADGSADATQVAAKAIAVGNMIGGAAGYGGTRMNGYMQHAEAQMGFMTGSDLAGQGNMMNVMLHNESGQACTFYLDYVASQEGAGEQTQDVSVAAGGEQVVQVPCSEVMGLGPLENPGAAGCVLADGQAFSNMMAVPGFLNMDYACGGTYHMYLQPDTDDLDGDGDTQELILSSEAMQTHMASGGPMGHTHAGRGMMP